MIRRFTRLLTMVALCLHAMTVAAQTVNYDKLSPMLRRVVRGQQAASGRQAAKGQPMPSCRREAGVCAFVKVSEGGEQRLREQGCRLLTQVGDICIADIPLGQIAPLTLDSRISRIEASRSQASLTTDSLALQINARPVYEGMQLPQAYTGRGVVVGVMDVGFDLSHPNFYSRDTTEYRIKRFWDMLSADTVGSRLYVGRDFAGREQLLSVAHARDGLDQTHGTHTLGIAAGSGYNSPYRGMAPESDICIVANAVSDDIAYIDSADYYKYTYATDALGFKYIMDYADSCGMPCVINFSEGSQQDFWGYDLLYYEMLSRLTGPGRIIVSAAGNYGNEKTWFRKERGTASAGSFLRSNSLMAMLTLKSADDFALRFVNYADGGNDTLTVAMGQVLQQPDSVLEQRLRMLGSDSLSVLIEAYPSCYNEEEVCYDLTIMGKNDIGTPPLSLEVVGMEASVEAYRVSGYLYEHELNPTLTAGERSHNILSPASSPDIICVGSTFYRDGIVNYLGQWKEASKGPAGSWQVNSSVGPTFDGRTKPDVLAPGMNIISSYSSYYFENHPTANDISWDVAHFPFNGRTYVWNSNSGTSMASPAVAGAIALWLQAVPTLTTQQILDVFEHTCRHYDPMLAYPNNHYGYGEIDVYRGLLYLLGLDGVDGLSATQTKARLTCNGHRLTADLGQPASRPLSLRLFSLSGQQLFSATLPSGQRTHTLTLPRLPHGVYAVQIDGPAPAAGSTLIRL